MNPTNKNLLIISVAGFAVKLIPEVLAGSRIVWLIQVLQWLNDRLDNSSSVVLHGV
jgi:fructose-specific phosphotransferase system IIC component